MFEKIRRRAWVVPVAAAAVLFAGGSVAHASTGDNPPSAATASSRGPNEYGMTRGDHAGHMSAFSYTHGWFCDRNISAQSVSGCEVGAKWKVAPSSKGDPLYITVPLGFKGKGMDCPDMLTCVDHPMNLDMTRLATALAPIYKTTPAKLMPALRNFTTPGHDHFITTTNGGKPEWWDVQVVGVTSPTVYRSIQVHQSWAYIAGLLKAKNKNVVGPIPTNLFLYFAAR